MIGGAGVPITAFWIFVFRFMMFAVIFMILCHRCLGVDELRLIKEQYVYNIRPGTFGLYNYDLRIATIQ